MILALHGIDSCIALYLVKRHTSRHAIVSKKLAWKLAPCIRYRGKYQVEKNYHWFKFLYKNTPRNEQRVTSKPRYLRFLQLCCWWRNHLGRGAVSGEEFPTFRKIALRSPSGSKQRFIIFRNVMNHSPKDIAWRPRTRASPSLNLASLLFGRTRHRWKDYE